MHPDKEECAICDGVGVLYCSLQGGLLCKPGRKAEPQCIDFDTRAKAAGYVKLEPGQVVVKRATAEIAEKALWFEMNTERRRGQLELGSKYRAPAYAKLQRAAVDDIRAALEVKP